MPNWQTCPQHGRYVTVCDGCKREGVSLVADLLAAKEAEIAALKAEVERLHAGYKGWWCAFHVEGAAEIQAENVKLRDKLRLAEAVCHEAAPVCDMNHNHDASFCDGAECVCHIKALTEALTKWRGAKEKEGTDE